MMLLNKKVMFDSLLHQHFSANHICACNGYTFCQTLISSSLVGNAQLDIIASCLLIPLFSFCSTMQYHLLQVCAVHLVHKYFIYVLSFFPFFSLHTVKYPSMHTVLLCKSCSYGNSYGVIRIVWVPLYS